MSKLAQPFFRCIVNCVSEGTAEAGDRDAEALTVLGDGAAGDVVARGGEGIAQCLVGQRMPLVFLVDKFCQSVQNLVGRNVGFRIGPFVEK